MILFSFLEIHVLAGVLVLDLRVLVLVGSEKVVGFHNWKQLQKNNRKHNSLIYGKVINMCVHGS